jgi:hypothetical protein
VRRSRVSGVDVGDGEVGDDVGVDVPVGDSDV